MAAMPAAYKSQGNQRLVGPRQVSGSSTEDAWSASEQAAPAPAPVSAQARAPSSPSTMDANSARMVPMPPMSPNSRGISRTRSGAQYAPPTRMTSATDVADPVVDAQHTMRDMDDMGTSEIKPKSPCPKAVKKLESSMKRLAKQMTGMQASVTKLDGARQQAVEAAFQLAKGSSVQMVSGCERMRSASPVGKLVHTTDQSACVGFAKQTTPNGYALDVVRCAPEADGRCPSAYDETRCTIVPLPAETMRAGITDIFQQW